MPYTTAQQTRYFKLRYETDPDFREKRLKANREWKSRNKQKIQAENKVDNLLRTGKLKRSNCIFCNKIGQAHHPDYSKPFKVVWLCPQHHTQVHKGIIVL